MSRILVCPTEHAGAIAEEERPSHVVGLAAPARHCERSEATQAVGVGFRPLFHDVDRVPSPLRGRWQAGALHLLFCFKNARRSRAMRSGGPDGGRAGSHDGFICPTPPTPSPSPRGGGEAYLHLVFNDIAEPRQGLVAPGRADIAALLGFAGAWDEARPLLVHCRMGISRSTAAALILAAAARPALGEQVLAEALRAAAPCATPNALMIALADDLLGRGGRLVAAARGIGRGADYAPYRMFALNLPARP